MIKIINLSEIKTLLKQNDIIPVIEKGFAAYSMGKAIVPPVGELLFPENCGEVHIKYGYIKDDEFYVIKVASGFYNNARFNLPSSNGLMLVFSIQTGALLGILLDEGYLTDVRTAAAGAIVAKYFAPKHVTKIGIVGSGTQAKLQLNYLRKIIDCREVMVCGRNKENLLRFKQELSEHFSVEITSDIDEITHHCNFIVTTTPATQALITADHVKQGTHITAVGADSAHKQELDPLLFAKADIVVADSISQAIKRGDSAHAIKQGILQKERILELGNVIAKLNVGRSSEDEITIADLTGVAVQDIQIAKFIYESANLF